MDRHVGILFHHRSLLQLTVVGIARLIRPEQVRPDTQRIPKHERSNNCETIRSDLREALHLVQRFTRGDFDRAIEKPRPGSWTDVKVVDSSVELVADRNGTASFSCLLIRRFRRSPTSAHHAVFERSVSGIGSFGSNRDEVSIGRNNSIRN